MKRINILISLLVLINFTIYGQSTVNYDKIIPPAEARHLSMPERLVQIAWQNQPNVEVLKSQLIIFKQDHKKARNAWFDYLNLGFNANEYTLGLRQNNQVDATGKPVSGNQFYPIFNASLNLKLNSFSYIPAEKKKTAENIKIGEENIKEKKLTLRATVLSSYQQYLMAKELLALQVEMTEDAASRNALFQQKFKDGKVSLDDLNLASNNLLDQKSRQIALEGRVELAKINLEELIGMKLEDVKL